MPELDLGGAFEQAGRGRDPGIGPVTITASFTPGLDVDVCEFRSVLDERLRIGGIELLPSEMGPRATRSYHLELGVSVAEAHDTVLTVELPVVGRIEPGDT